MPVNFLYKYLRFIIITDRTAESSHTTDVNDRGGVNHYRVIRTANSNSATAAGMIHSRLVTVKFLMSSMTIVMWATIWKSLRVGPDSPV